MQCPWCDGKDKNLRPLRMGIVPCANPWHNEDAQRADKPCKKHNEHLPCSKCRIEELEVEVEM